MSRSSYIIWYVSVPDFETSPIRPALVMSAGMMPALDLPGLIRPGQLGPISRVVPLLRPGGRTPRCRAPGCPR